MDQQKMQEMYKLHERAKRMERLGNDTEALNIYMKIHEDYFANTSDLYERPAVILEKKRRFQEAIDICNKAIELIKNDKITGTVEHFEKRRRKIEARMGKDGLDQSTEKKQIVVKWNPASWKLSDWLKFLLVLSSLMAALYFFLPDKSPYDDLYIDMSEMERASELEGSPFQEPEEPAFPVTQDMISIARTDIMGHVEVVDANVIPQDDTIGFALLTAPGTSKDRCEKLAVDFIKALSSAAASAYPELKAPNALSLGELYDHYDIVVSAGDTPENIIAKGTKNKNQNLINWRD